MRLVFIVVFVAFVFIGGPAAQLQIALPPGGVITGTIVDDFGDPVSGADVTAMVRMPGAAGAPLMRAVTAGGFARTEGAVTDDRGNAVLDATILVFPGDPAHWTFSSRYIRSARPDTSGRYLLRALRPYADYRLIAVRDVADEELRDPEFLASVREQARRFSLGEGETRIENVRVRD